MKTDLCLRGSFAMKKHLDQCSPYKGKHFTGADLQIQWFRPLSSWWCADRHGTGEGAESPQATEVTVPF